MFSNQPNPMTSTQKMANGFVKQELNKFTKCWRNDMRVILRSEKQINQRNILYIYHEYDPCLGGFQTEN